LARTPHNVEDGQIRGADQDISEGTWLLTELTDDLAWFGYRTANDLTDGVIAPLRESGTTIGGEAIDIKH
jgi:hypothetical protein